MTFNLTRTLKLKPSTQVEVEGYYPGRDYYYSTAGMALQLQVASEVQVHWQVARASDSGGSESLALPA